MMLVKLIKNIFLLILTIVVGSSIIFGLGVLFLNVESIEYLLISIMVYCALCFYYFFKKTSKSKNTNNNGLNDKSELNYQPSNEVISKLTVNGNSDGMTLNSEPETLTNTDNILSKMEVEEKYALLVGLLCLYGDGEFSQAEIDAVKKLIVKLDLKPKGLEHMDVTDKQLCLDEKTAWLITIIKDSFVGNVNLSKREIKKLFKILTKSMNKSVKDKFATQKERMAYAKEIKLSLEEIGNSDGTLSKGEINLIRLYKNESTFILSKRDILINICFFGFVFYIIYILV